MVWCDICIGNTEWCGSSPLESLRRTFTTSDHVMQRNVWMIAPRILGCSVETSDHKMWSLVWSQLCDHTMWVWSQGSVWSLQDRVNHTAFQACISILGIVINLCSDAPEFCLTVVSETAEKCFLTGGSQAVDVITRKCDHKCDHLVITRSHLWSLEWSQHCGEGLASWLYYIIWCKHIHITSLRYTIN